MLNPIEFKSVPANFKKIVWHGKDGVVDVPGIQHSESKVTIIRLEFSEQDRRQMIEGNPIYLAIYGKVVPFAASANLGELTSLARERNSG
jgi:hypothetical protein